MIAELAVTEQYGLSILFRAAWITLTVHPELEDNLEKRPG